MAWYRCPRCKGVSEWKGRNTKTLRDHCWEVPVTLRKVRKPAKPRGAA